jgi:hypothetical protein
MANLSVMTGTGTLVQGSTVLAPISYRIDLRAGVGEVRGAIPIPSAHDSHIFELRLEGGGTVEVHLTQSMPLSGFARVKTSGPIR